MHPRPRSTEPAVLGTLDFRMTDTSLRDGSHAKRHRFTTEHVRDIVSGLDAAGVPVIEVTHGDGLGGSSYNYGFSLTDERELMATSGEGRRHRQDRRADASGRRHEGRHQVHRRRGRVDRPRRDPLHRSRHLHPALRPRPRAGPRDRGLPDDGAHQRPGLTGGARPDHGRRRLPVRLRRRLRGRADPRPGRGPRRGPRRQSSETTRRSASTATRTSRSGSRTAWSRTVPAPCRSTVRPDVSVQERETLRARRWRPCAIGSASKPASTCSR